MKTLNSNIIARKNELAGSSSWLLLVVFTITGIKTINYDAEVTAFTVGADLTGEDSFATGKIIAVQDSGSTGTLTLWNVKGTFINNETITDSEGGEADANGSQSDNDLVYRWARNRADVSFESNTYTKKNIDLGVVTVGLEPSSETVALGVGNDDETFDRYVDSCEGLEGSDVNLKIVNSAHLTVGEVEEEDYKVLLASRPPGGGRIAFSLGQNENSKEEFPRRKYQRSPCGSRFKDSNFCQYASSDTSCEILISDCIAKSNEEHFGAFPAIPGGYF